jgi:aminoglycoside N3'-acetyltransferase
MRGKARIKTFLKHILLRYPGYLKMKLLTPILRRKYYDYDTKDFISSLQKVGIIPGDSIFLMYSQDKVYFKTGKRISVNLLLQDILDYLGQDGTVMALCFSLDRRKIVAKESLFDIKKTPTECGILSETLRRKRGSERSLHPIFSAISYGKKAKFFSDSHHTSPYPFDSTSPYFKLMADGGKYLGIGVGFEAFTPCHMVEDYFKDEFKQKIYFDTPDKFSVVLSDGNCKSLDAYVRNHKTFTGDGFDPIYYFKLLDIPHERAFTRSGINLFVFRIQDFFDAAIEIYQSQGITVWDTGSIHSQIKRRLRCLMRFFLVKIKLL